MPVVKDAPLASIPHRTRLHARTRIDSGPEAAVDDRDGAQRGALGLLNVALATAMLSMLRYRRDHFMAGGRNGSRIAVEFLVHADEEQANADLIAERIVQLGGEPNFAPQAPRQRTQPPGVATNEVGRVRENLLAQRAAIATYRDLIAHLGERDPPTRRLLEGVLGIEEAHAHELLDLLQSDTHS